MFSSRHIKVIAIGFIFGVCIFSFQNFTDPDSQNETLDYMEVENEVLQTSTDDLAAQQREAKEQARLAEQEKANAEAKLQKTRSRREQVAIEAKVKIAQDLARRKRSIETRDRLLSECKKLEKEISVLEQKMEKAEQDARMAREEVKGARLNYNQLRQRKAQLLEIAKMKQERQRRASMKGKPRSIASFGNTGLPRVLPPKRSQ